jgi:hypothetical protein
MVGHYGLRIEFNNIAQAIAAGGGDIPALVAMLKERDRKLKLLDARLDDRSRPNREALRAALEQRVTEWRKILRSHTRQARMVLQQVMLGPITLHDEAGRPSWLGQPRPAGLLAGIANGTSVASLTGFEPVLPP